MVSLLVFTGLKDYWALQISKQQKILEDFILNSCLFAKTWVNAIFGYEIHSAEYSIAKVA